MANRILFVPVDERFCTRDYFLLLAEGAGLEVATPSRSYLGAKKVPPDLQRLRHWTLGEAREGDTVIASVDMLVHGGLIPSRLSLDSFATLRQRLSVFSQIKAKGARVYASACVTRAPTCDSAEEEPDYWAWYGSRLHALSKVQSRFRDRAAAGSAGAGRPSASHQELRDAARGIPQWVVEDFLRRRLRNFRLISRVLELVRDGAIDFLNLVLDDNAEGSISLWEARRHERKAQELGVGGRVSVHAGADEATLTLLARFLCDLHGVKPRVLVEYSSPEHRGLIPPYEGRPLEEGVRSHVESAGGIVVQGEEDILLFVHNPVDRREASRQACPRAGRSLYNRICRRLSEYSGIAGIAGVRYTNGSDDRLVRSLLARPLDWKRLAYAGWNTAGNTLGSVCAFAFVRWLALKGLLPACHEKLLRLQTIFLIEHWGYQAHVRQELARVALLRGVRGGQLGPIEQDAVRIAEEKLSPYARAVEKALGCRLGGLRVFFPWHRTFEAGIELH